MKIIIIIITVIIFSFVSCELTPTEGVFIVKDILNTDIEAKESTYSIIPLNSYGLGNSFFIREKIGAYNIGDTLVVHKYTSETKVE